MSKRFKFTMSRTAIIEEFYEIEADSLDEAVEAFYDGAYGEPVHTEFIDWHGEWEEADREELCPLHQMIKEYECDTTSSAGTAKA
jgi:hypothetical protein